MRSLRVPFVTFPRVFPNAISVPPAFPCVFPAFPRTFIRTMGCFPPMFPKHLPCVPPCVLPCRLQHATPYVPPNGVSDRLPPTFPCIRCGLPSAFICPFHHAFSVRSRAYSPVRSSCISLVFLCVSLAFHHALSASVLQYAIPCVLQWIFGRFPTTFP